MAAGTPSQSHPFAQLAIDAIKAYVRDFHVISPEEHLLDRFPLLRQRAGAFVSLKKYGDLRGCIGTIEPTRDFLALEIIENAISASTRDPRFRPVAEDELRELKVSVDILSPPQRVSGMHELDIRRYGLIVTCGTRRGLLLPDIEGIASVEEQVTVARKKGGIGEVETVDLYRFEVERYF
jgi:MEMO1 family protein